MAPVILVVFGLLLGGSDEDLMNAIAADPIGALASILPTWVLVPFLLTAVLALVSGAVLGIYSSGLTLLSLGIRIPRPSAAAIDGVILTIGTVFVVFFATDFLGPFQSFLITLGVPLASWAGILIADILRRKKDYDEEALFDQNGRYGAWDSTSIGTLVVTSVIGWGLVVNNFAEDAAWNNWQGYLLFLIGGRDGEWAYANLGVFFALVLSFLVTYFARGCEDPAPGGGVSAPATGDTWLVVIDPQAIFAAPDSAWGSPFFGEAMPRIRALADAFGDRVLVTRWMPTADRSTSWGDYFAAWPFADQPPSDPLFALVPEAAAPLPASEHRPADVRQVGARARGGRRTRRASRARRGSRPTAA